ncbi:MAG: META domain-containing protein [Pseudomonadota bacterium]
MRTATALLVLLAACGPDETISGFVDPAQRWQLVELGGVAWEVIATVQFPEEGRVVGRGPCNRFSGAQAAPYPWIDIGPLAVTRMACPELEAEGAFLAALEAAAFAEVSGDVLILTDEAGREMVFKAAPERE